MTGWASFVSARSGVTTPIAMATTILPPPFPYTYQYDYLVCINFTMVFVHVDLSLWENKWGFMSSSLGGGWGGVYWMPKVDTPYSNNSLEFFSTWNILIKKIKPLWKVDEQQFENSTNNHRGHISLEDQSSSFSMQVTHLLMYVLLCVQKNDICWNVGSRVNNGTNLLHA